MMNEQLKGLVPELRFPEFQKNWNLKALGKCLDYLQPTKYLVSDSNYDNKFKTPVLTAGKTFILGYTNENEGIYNENLPVVIFDDFTTDSKFVDFPFKAKSSAMKILLAKNDVDIRFCYELIQLIKGQAGVHKRHWISIFSKIRIPIPELKEQKKIADCFSSINELIAAHTQKLDALITYKKGLMQQLFPSELETIPNLRFPEYLEDGEWIKRKVSYLLRKISNPVEVNSDELYREIGIRSHGKGIFHKNPIRGIELGNKRVFWVEENAFIVNIVFAWELAVANTTKSESGMIASHRFPMYKSYKNRVDITYIKYFFLTQKGKELLWIASPGGAGRNKTLGQKNFENLEFLIAKSIDEQKKISNFLSSIDELITSEIQNIDSLKTHKTGLMQKLFPNIGEV